MATNKPSYIYETSQPTAPEGWKRYIPLAGCCWYLYERELTLDEMDEYEMKLVHHRPAFPIKPSPEPHTRTISTKTTTESNSK